MNWYQLISFGFLFILYILCNDFNEKKIIIKFIILFSSWFFGYAFMMFLKWVYYAIFIDRDFIINDIINRIKYETGDAKGEGKISINLYYYLRIIYRNIVEGFFSFRFVLSEIIYIFYILLDKKKIIKNLYLTKTFHY